MPKHKHLLRSIFTVLVTVLMVTTVFMVAHPKPSYADSNETPDVHSTCPKDNTTAICTGDPVVSGDNCGSGSTRVNTSLDYGCNGSGNGIIDFLYAVVRFMTAGVGLVVIASVVYAGIQYTTSQGDPNQAAKAIARVRDSLLALIVYIFAFALLNWLIPGGLGIF